MNRTNRRKIHPGSFTTGLLFGVMLVLTFAAGAGMSKLSSAPGPVEATAFTLVDKVGSVRGTWGTRDGAAELVMNDTNGKPRIDIRVADHPVIKFWNDKAEDCVILSEGKEAGTVLDLIGQDSKARVHLQAAKNFAQEVLKDGEGRTRFRAYCTPWGEFLLSALNENGNKTWGEVNGEKQPTPDKK